MSQVHSLGGKDLLRYTDQAFIHLNCIARYGSYAYNPNIHDTEAGG